ncbi:MAG TPA: hypothetical protein VGR14_12395 [Verrucomicrobiae bacterium]|nr:hypothetical protein [Verrucomicrobiae bacterium]
MAAPGPPTYVGGYELPLPGRDASPSRFLLPADVFMIHHGHDFTPIRERQKTYRRLFGMIFFGGFGLMLVAAMQWLVEAKSSKNMKKGKAKYHFHFAKPRFTCQNAPKKAFFFCQY